MRAGLLALLARTMPGRHLDGDKGHGSHDPSNSHAPRRNISLSILPLPPVNRGLLNHATLGVVVGVAPFSHSLGTLRPSRSPPCGSPPPASVSVSASVGVII